MTYHIPVLLNECIDGLNIMPDGTYVDLTYGGGGHSKAILEKLGPAGRLIAFDQDNDAQANKIDDERLILINQNFKFMKSNLKLLKALPVDGVLADLGISSHQIDSGERGFSIRFEAALDMRMNQNQELNAYLVINSYEEEKLKFIFKFYGELPEAGKIAKHLINVRSDRQIKTTSQLIDLLKGFRPANKLNKFLAQVFQAIRIEVNNELESLKSMLLQTIEVIRPGGRLVVMSYHSLEDRLVKQLMKQGKLDGEAEKDLYGRVYLPFKMLTSKPITPSEEEIKVNSRARSAILRIAVKHEYEN